MCKSCFTKNACLSHFSPVWLAFNFIFLYGKQITLMFPRQLSGFANCWEAMFYLSFPQVFTSELLHKNRAHGICSVHFMVMSYKYEKCIPET